MLGKTVQKSCRSLRFLLFEIQKALSEYLRSKPWKKIRGQFL